MIRYANMAFCKVDEAVEVLGREHSIRVTTINYVNGQKAFAMLNPEYFSRASG